MMKDYYSAPERSMEEKAKYAAFNKLNEKYGYAPVGIKEHTIMGKRSMINPFNGRLNLVAEANPEVGQIKSTPARLMDQYLEEYSHYQQYNQNPEESKLKKTGRFLGHMAKDFSEMIKNTKGLNFKKGYDKNYVTPGTTEYEAHKVIQPKLQKELDDTADQLFQDRSNMAMGGSIPGSVSFTYARTQDPAPSNGKYAKKTLASAQNGKYVKKKIKGIERELTEKYIEPQVDKAFEKARQEGIGYGLHNGPYDAVRHAASASKVASSLPIVGMPMANILGAAHELSAGRGGLKELGSDLYNNFVGSVIGSIPFVSDDKKLDLIIAAQKNGILSTISNKNTESSSPDKVMKNPIMKKKPFQNGGEMEYYQNGLDWKPKSISKNGKWLDNYSEPIKDDRGQWAHPGEVTEINSNEITMEGVDYPVLGVSDTGDTKMMEPGKDYNFKGKKVTEYPMMKKGGWLNKYK